MQSMNMPLDLIFCKCIVLVYRCCQSFLNLTQYINCSYLWRYLFKNAIFAKNTYNGFTRRTYHKND